jgi:hypothetical protein
MVVVFISEDDVVDDMLYVDESVKEERDGVGQ